MYGVFVEECHQYHSDNFAILVYFCRHWSTTISGRESSCLSGTRPVSETEVISKEPAC
jgi:hypothetical protein